MPENDCLARQLRHVPFEQHGEAIRALAAKGPVLQSLNFSHPGNFLPGSSEARRFSPLFGQNMLESMKRLPEVVLVCAWFLFWQYRDQPPEGGVCDAIVTPFAGVCDPRPQLLRIVACRDQAENFCGVAHSCSP